MTSTVLLRVFSKTSLSIRKVSLGQIGAMVLACLLISPVLAIFYQSISNNDGLWPHLMNTVIPRYVATTVLLMFGTGLLSLTMGISTAWIIARYEFRMSRLFDVVLILPIACPAYLVAYAYTDFFEYAGPLQGIMREFMGWRTPQDYWFPEIRSLGGAIFVLSLVLYPYIFLMARSAFQMVPSSFYDVGSLSSKSLFWNIAFPLSRPAIIAGLALVQMEVISDFGTVEFFAVETLTLGIFNVWLGMDSISGAAQIASGTFSLIILLLLLERYARGKRRYNDTARANSFIARKQVTLAKGMLLQAICFVPCMLGFFVPLFILAWNASFAQPDLIGEDVLKIAGHTVLLAFIGALGVIMTGLVLASAGGNAQGNRVMKVLTQLSASGYAVPGTMLAIGVLGVVAFWDRVLAFAGLYLGGTFAVLIFAYIVRFQAVGYGAIVSGISKVSPSTLQASRSLGMGPYQTTRRVTLPLISKTMMVGFVLAFVDISKELPMTLLLRPFDFETLATYAYQFAHSEQMDIASVPALLIILIGIFPALLLNRFTQSS